MTSSDYITWSGVFVPRDDIETSEHVLTLSANYSDVFGNTGVVSSKSNIFMIDTKHPTVSSFTIDKSVLKIGETATVTIIFSEPVISFSKTNISDHENLSNGTSHFNHMKWTFTYTAPTSFENEALVLTLDDSWSDVAGNTPINAYETNPFKVDTVAPSTITTNSITTVGGNVEQSKLNSTNTHINIDIPIFDDSTLVGGSLQLQYKEGENGTWVDVDSALPITQSMLSSNYIHNVDLTSINVSNNSDIYFRTNVVDNAGNETGGHEGNNKLTTNLTPIITLDETDSSSYTTTSMGDDEFIVVETSTTSVNDELSFNHYIEEMATAENYKSFEIIHTKPDGTHITVNQNETHFQIDETNSGLHVITYTATDLVGNETIKRRYVLMSYIHSDRRDNDVVTCEKSGDVNNDDETNIFDILDLIDIVMSI